MRACVMTRNGAFEIDLTEKGRCISERFRIRRGVYSGNCDDAKAKQSYEWLVLLVSLAVF